MGMFDTIHLKLPLVCPTCGAGQYNHQTHAFEDVMAAYRIGSVVRGGVLTGIVKETFWCPACHKTEDYAVTPVFLVIWHSILVGVEQDPIRAEARLASVDRLDLIGWLDEAQQDANQWRARFYGLLNDVRRWNDHLAQQKNPEPAPEGEAASQAERRKTFAGLWGLPEEILSAPDPLAAIVEKNTPELGEPLQDSIWG
jgi:hypothetical protein